MGRDKIRIHISIFKIPVSDELILEIHIGGDPLDDQLSQALRILAMADGRSLSWTMSFKIMES